MSAAARNAGRRPRVAVVGHTEWVTHSLGPMPGPGRITHLTDPLDEPGGGGAVAAARAVAIGAECHLFTALGVDDLGTRARDVLESRGVVVHAAPRELQTRALSAIDAHGDRAIAVVGERHHPVPGDELPWALLRDMDAVYYTGRDDEVLRRCRACRILVVMARRWPVLADAGVVCDVLVGSANDPEEIPPPGALSPLPLATVSTDGARGGRLTTRAGAEWRWDAVHPPGPPLDSYGCGDSFAAGLTVALAHDRSLRDAVALGARCGADAVTHRGGLPPAQRPSAAG
ncbi:MAG: PfkB family carbohydrate kinase [Thermoleophilia bacterium]